MRNLVMRFGLQSAIVGAAFALAACSQAMNYARQEYSGVDVQSIDVAGDDIYRVFDKPAAGKMMITPSIGQTVQRKLAGTLPGKPQFETAVRAFLDRSGRQACKIIDGRLLEAPQWEFTYACGSPGI